MRVARIMTSTPEQVSAAADHLRASGYAVEIAAPGQLQANDADLHIDAVGCDSGEALSRAVQALEQKPRRVIAYDLTGRPVEFADEEEETKPAASVWERARAGAREVGENLRLSFEHLREWMQEGRDTIAQKKAERDARRAEQVRQRTRLDFVRAQAAEAERVQQQEEEEVRQAALREQRVREESEERARREAAERAQSALAERERQQALEREREERRAAELRREEQERARQSALAEEQRRREQERAAEQARLARERQLREEQEQRERQLRAQEELRRAAEERRLARIAAEREQFAAQQALAARNVTPAEAVVRQRPEPPVQHRVRRDNDFKKAMAVAAGLALLATLGYAAYENRRPATPLSNRDIVRSQAITQPVPFGAATATPPAAATRPQQALPQSSVAPSAAKPIPAKPRVRAQSRRDRDNTVADDEVVVHRTSTPAAATVATGSGTKHYSDLEQ